MCDERKGFEPPVEMRKSMPVFRCRHVAKGIRKPGGREFTSVHEFSGRKALAFCGIARPGSFLCTLRETGIRVVDFVPYPDHHGFTAGDAAELAGRARAAGAEMVITTEKDAVKFRDLPFDDPPLWALNVELSLLDHHEEWEWYIMGVIKG
jgi:tetraacyldisaccharide 4'-kinase